MPGDLLIGLHPLPGATTDALRRLAEAALSAHHLQISEVAGVVTCSDAAGDAAVQGVASVWGVTVRGFGVPELAAQDVPTPSARLRDRIGTGSICEAGVLAAGAQIVVTKHLSAAGSIAIGRLPGPAATRD